MCCRKCCRCLFNVIIPYSILCIFLFQIYSQYSTLVTLRTKLDNIRDGRNTMSNYQLSKDKHYDFNMNKVQESFEDNALMNISPLKNAVLNLIEKRNNKKEDFDNRVYMFYYLIVYDFICLIIVYFFIYGYIKAGILKIIFQAFHFYFNWKRMQKFNTDMPVFSIIKSKLDNMYKLRGWNIFNPEGFLVIEFLCNFAIILDILLLIIYLYQLRYKKMKKIKIDFDDRDSSFDEKENNQNNNSENNIYNNKSNEKNSENGDESNGDGIGIILNKKDDNNNNNLEGGTLNPTFENEEDEEDVEVSEEEDPKENGQETKE